MLWQEYLCRHKVCCGKSICAGIRHAVAGGSVQAVESEGE